MRTEYLKKLILVASKVIPVISTYSEMTGEHGSITLQENDIRPYFKTIAFRTFINTFPRDIIQIRALIQNDDYVIMDWEEMELDIGDGDMQDYFGSIVNTHELNRFKSSRFKMLRKV